MSSGLSCAAIAAMIAFLRVPSFNWRNWLARYADFWPARFGIASVTLTPFKPWQAEHTASARALPAATLTGVCDQVTEPTVASASEAIQVFMRSPCVCADAPEPLAGYTKRRYARIRAVDEDRASGITLRSSRLRGPAKRRLQAGGLGGCRFEQRLHVRRQ